MRRSWLLIGIALLAAVFAIGAVACGGDDDNGDDVDDLIDDVVDDLDDLGVLLLVATVAEMEGSGVSGAVDISPNGDGILVSVVLDGLPEGERENHLHHGSCAEQGDIHITLDNVVADEAGDGTQTTANDEESLAHYETGHYYAVHDEAGAVIGCGDVVSGT